LVLLFFFLAVEKLLGKQCYFRTVVKKSVVSNSSCAQEKVYAFFNSLRAPYNQRFKANTLLEYCVDNIIIITE